jgi:hypothetical protein
MFAVFLTAAVVLQWLGNAYRSEFGSDPDEPAHYVTGLLVRDYIAAGAPGAPMEYAREYYRHYPKVALGHWPPVFYSVQAAWTLVLSPSRASLLMLMAVVAALTATVLFAALYDCVPAAVAAAAGFVFLSLPLTQVLSRSVMADGPTALLAFLATLCFGRYLDSGRWRHAAWFGLWSSAAILTKGSAFALAIVPVVCVALERRWRLPAKWPFWLPLLIVAALCGPWYLLAPGARHEAVASYGGFGANPSWKHAASYIQVCLVVLGPMLVVLAGIGAVERMGWFERKSISGKWPAALGLFLGSGAMWVIVGASKNRRNLEIAVPAMLMFAAVGVSWLISLNWAQAWSQRRKSLAVLAASLLLCGWWAAVTPPKLWRGYDRLVESLLARRELRDRNFLISSDAAGEGSFIAETAMREERPGHVILRASKVFAKEGWLGRAYALTARTPKEIAEVVRREGVAVVVDLAPRTWTPHQRLIVETIKADPERWERLGPESRNGFLVARLRDSATPR